MTDTAVHPAPRTISHVANTLAKNRLGVFSVLCFVIAAAAPLTVVAGGATAAFGITGSLAIPLSYLVIAVVLAVFASGYVAMSRRLPHAGAFYTYLTYGLGKPMGVSGAFIAVLAYNFMQIGLIGGFGKVAADFINARTTWDLSWWVCALAGWALIAVLGVLRIDLNGKILGVLLGAEIIITVVYDSVMVSHPAGGALTFSTLNPSLLWSTGIGAAMAVAIAGFVGFEATVVFSEETKNPKRTVARATYLALAITGVLYGLSAWAMSVATGPDRIVQAAATDGSLLIFNLAAPHVSSVLISAGNALFVSSLFAAMLSFHHTTARYTYSLGREGVLPKGLARTGARTNAPYNASLLQSAIALAVVVLYAVNGWDPYVKMFFWLTVLGGLGVLILMTCTSLAVIGYFRRNPDGETLWRRMLAPAIAALALAVVLGVTLDQIEILLGVPAGSPEAWMLPATFAVAAVAGLLWALWLKASRSPAYAAIGLGPGNSPIPTADPAPRSAA